MKIILDSNAVSPYIEVDDIINGFDGATEYLEEWFYFYVVKCFDIFNELV